MNISYGYKSEKALVTQIDKLISQQKLDAAEELCNSVLSKDENYADVFEKLGDIYSLRDRVIEASIFFEKALKISPDNLSVRQKLEAINNHSDNYYHSGKINGPISSQLTNESLSHSIAEDEKPDINSNNLISAEIINDELYAIIVELSKNESVRNILEIGSSSGEGSTEAFVRGIQNKKNKTNLFCIELDRDMFTKLQRTYSRKPFVKCYNASSVSSNNMLSEEQTRLFYELKKSNLNHYPLELVLSWLKQDKLNILKTDLNINGIQKIKKENNINTFDLVLIDGSLFTGDAELNEVYGSDIIILQNINSIKNYNNYHRLLADYSYSLVHENITLRNGYAIFKKTIVENNSTTVTDNDVENFDFDSEKGEEKLARNLVKKGMCVFDVGANIGVYTKLLCELTGSKGSVYAFEPSKQTFNILNKKINKSQLKNAVLINAAVYSEETVIEFNEFAQEYSAWNSIGHPVMPDPEDHRRIVPIVKSSRVKTVQLDSFCREHNVEKIDYLKVDVEGAEIFVLKGAQELLQNKKIGYLQFEISQKMLEGLKTKAKEVFTLLNKFGYECHKINEDGKIGEQVYDSNSFYENYIAYPTELKSIQKKVSLHAEPNSAVILDIGAHNGQSLERLYLEYKNFKSVEIHSFEPIPENYLCLRSAAEKLMSRYPNLRIHSYNFAMDKESKLAPFYCYGMHGLETNQYSSLLQFKEKEKWLELLPDQPHANLELTKVIVVPCHTGTEFCSILDITEIEYLKIDTQGNDFNVLKGVENLLKKKCIKTIEAECQKIELYKGGATFSEIENLLSGYGYEKEKIDYQASGLEYVVRYVLKDSRKIDEPEPLKNVNIVSDAGSLSEPVIDLLIPDFFASWNASDGWINAIKRAGKPGNILRPKQDSHRFVFDYLKNPRADIMLMLSFDHHTPYLHMNDEYRDLWRQSPITKVLIAEETVIQDCYPDNVKKSESALECIDAVFYSSLSDRKFYSNFDIPNFWLPFGVDEEKFTNRVPFQGRSGRPYFRGKTKPIGLPQTYEKRRQLLKILLERDLVDFKEFEYINSVDQLVDEFNRYKISINLPAVFQGFTTRVFESLACGCTLISPKPVQVEEQNLFSDNYHLLYYDENDPEEFLRKIEYAVNDFESAEKIAAQGYYEVLSKHTLINRLQVILNKLEVLNLNKAAYAPM